MEQHPDQTPPNDDNAAQSRDNIPFAQPESHKTIARYERYWITFSLSMSFLFLILIVYTLATQGGNIAHSAHRDQPAQLLSEGRFANPGVVDLGDGRYEVSIVAQAYNFSPGEVRLPAGAEVTFYVTARDVIHGFEVQYTNINVEVLPGEVSSLQYTFREPREHRVVCNEYCGIGHHNMISKIIVMEPNDYQDFMVMQAQEAERAEAALAEGGEAAWRALGERVYAANCVSCHQASGGGIPGAFPPLKNHAVALYRADKGRDYLINTLLYGVAGQIQVQGNNYNGQMPAWQQLSNDDIAAVINHIVTAWDNETQLPSGWVPFRAEEVAERRSNPRSTQEVYALRQSMRFDAIGDVDDRVSFANAAPVAPRAAPSSSSAPTASVTTPAAPAASAARPAPAAPAPSSAAPTRSVALPSAEDDQRAFAENWRAFGQRTYEAQCSACHQADGRGISGVFPPLAEHLPRFYNQGAQEYLISTVLYGVQGPIVINGRQYGGNMPAWSHLSDAQIAAALSYSLTAWDGLRSSEAPITPAAVRQQRGRGLSAEAVHRLRQTLVRD